jgi:NAD(P)-dependent dehydrogenase (short-subunit alcohol dehydrogenase family)
MKTVIITGASGNLGKVVTQLFLDKEYRVIAVVSSENQAAFLQHPQLTIAVVDLTDETAADTFVSSAINKYGEIHAALLLVGGFEAGNIAETSGAAISRQVSLNFNTAYFTARPLLRHMQSNKKGKLIFIGARPSLDATYGKDLIAYSLSKSLLFTLAEQVNADAKGTSVTATVIAPSTLDTPLNRKSMPDTDPANWVKLEDLASIIEFVVAEKASALRETVLKVYNNG